MGENACLAVDFCRCEAPNDKGVGDQGTMTAPWNSLGTHDCGSRLPRHHDKGIQRLLELRTLYVIRITAKAGVVPPRIDRVTASMTESAQLRHMRVSNPHFLQRARQIIAIELRIMPGARDRTHIGQALYVVGLQESEKLFNTPRRMSHRQEFLLA